ncbi:unnamed protein product [Prorocentrum cordatum]|uniref:Coenzyme Q-binding protein COQ10 START domain-containing protein n=1 Tax=Prorocentrum cordatum TaxID=2364126 RepID=A0ABN9RLG9_9DINO|nr:unnamed protein product [Polarella glacialis]
MWPPVAFAMPVAPGHRVAASTCGAAVVPSARPPSAAAAAPRRSSSRLCPSAALALAALGMPVGGGRGGGRAGARAGGRVRRRAREVVVELERSAKVLLESGTVASMDAFMAEHSTAVALQNVEKTEEEAGDSGQTLCYLEPTTIGPFSTQVRLTVGISLPESGECDIDVMKIEAGSVKKAGAGNFKRLFAHTKTRNSMSWKMGSERGLEVTYTTFARAVAGLPFWFPFPEGWVKSAIEGQISQIVSSLQGEVMDRLRDKYMAWEAAAGFRESR